MEDFIVSSSYEGYVYVGHAQGNSEQERENPKTKQKETVKVPYCNVYILQPCSTYVSEDYQAWGMKAVQYKCLNRECLKSLIPGEQVNLFFDEKKRVQLVASVAAMTASKAAADKPKDNK